MYTKQNLPTKLKGEFEKNTVNKGKVKLTSILS